MINLKLMEMRNKVKEELEHIPKGDMYQNMLRAAYFSGRMNSMGKNSKLPNDRNEVLKASINAVEEWTKKNNIKFEPQFDKRFFRI